MKVVTENISNEPNLKQLDLFSQDFSLNESVSFEARFKQRLFNELSNQSIDCDDLSASELRDLLLELSQELMFEITEDVNFACTQNEIVVDLVEKIVDGFEKRKELCEELVITEKPAEILNQHLGFGPVDKDFKVVQIENNPLGIIIYCDESIYDKQFFRKSLAAALTSNNMSSFLRGRVVFQSVDETFGRYGLNENGQATRLHELGHVFELSINGTPECKNRELLLAVAVSRLANYDLDAIKELVNDLKEFYRGYARSEIYSYREQGHKVESLQSLLVDNFQLKDLSSQASIISESYHLSSERRSEVYKLYLDASVEIRNDIIEYRFLVNLLAEQGLSKDELQTLIFDNPLNEVDSMLDILEMSREDLSIQIAYYETNLVSKFTDLYTRIINETGVKLTDKDYDILSEAEFYAPIQCIEVAVDFLTKSKLGALDFTKVSKVIVSALLRESDDRKLLVAIDYIKSNFQEIYKRSKKLVDYSTSEELANILKALASRELFVVKEDYKPNQFNFSLFPYYDSPPTDPPIRS